jgi:hypothetical protein
MAMAAALVGPDPARVVDDCVQGILEGLHTLAEPASQQDDQKRTEGRQKVGTSLTAAKLACAATLPRRGMRRLHHNAAA